MNFGQAVEALKDGKKVARSGWNGKSMWLVLVPGTPNCSLSAGTPYHDALNTSHQGQSHVTINPHIDMYNAQGEMQPGWLANQPDILAEDWEIVP